MSLACIGTELSSAEISFALIGTESPVGEISFEFIGTDLSSVEISLSLIAKVRQWKSLAVQTSVSVGWALSGFWSRNFLQHCLVPGELVESKKGFKI